MLRGKVELAYMGGRGKKVDQRMVKGMTKEEREHKGWVVRYCRLSVVEFWVRVIACVCGEGDMKAMQEALIGPYVHGFITISYAMKPLHG